MQLCSRARYLGLGMRCEAGICTIVIIVTVRLLKLQSNGLIWMLGFQVFIHSHETHILTDKQFTFTYQPDFP